MRKLYIYFYDDNGVLIDIEPVDSVQEQKSYMIENEQGEMVFPSGVTDVAPPNGMSMHLGVSPIYDVDSKTWSEDLNAINTYLSTVKNNTQVSDKERLEALEQAMMEVILSNG